MLRVRVGRESIESAKCADLVNNLTLTEQFPAKKRQAAIFCWTRTMAGRYKFSSAETKVGDALAQHPFKMAGVVGLQQCRFARQVKVPQPRDPETQGRSAFHGR